MTARRCTCGQHQIDPPRAFFGEGGSVHGPKFCTDHTGRTIPPARETCDTCERPAAYCYGIGGGWGLACHECRDVTLQPVVRRDGSTWDWPTMAEADFYSLGPDGRMTAEADARWLAEVTS